MAIALHSARLAASAILKGEDEGVYHQAMRRDAGPPVRLAYGLYRASRAAAVKSAMVGVARVWPGVLGTVARRTRVAAS